MERWSVMVSFTKTIKKIIVHPLFGVPAATVGGTDTPWHTHGYASGPITEIIVWVL